MSGVLASFRIAKCARCGAKRPGYLCDGEPRCYNCNNAQGSRPYISVKRSLPVADTSAVPFLPPLDKPKRNKYGAVKTVVDGYTFDSKAEAKRYQELKLLERGGYIRQLELQPEYNIVINAKHVCKVLLDFRYFEGQERVIEDVKGKDNALSRLKRKLVEAMYPGTKVRVVS